MTVLRLTAVAYLFLPFVVRVQGAPAPPSVSQTCTYSCPAAAEAAVTLEYPVTFVEQYKEPFNSYLCSYWYCPDGSDSCEYPMEAIGCYYNIGNGELDGSGYNPIVPGSCPLEADWQCVTSRRKKRSTLRDPEAVAKPRSFTTTRWERWSAERSSRTRKN